MIKTNKVKKLSCFDCKNSFMSDCYLECYKHNRINNSSICKDFVKKEDKKWQKQIKKL